MHSPGKKLRGSNEALTCLAVLYMMCMCMFIDFILFQYKMQHFKTLITTVNKVNHRTQRIPVVSRKKTKVFNGTRKVTNATS